MTPVGPILRSTVATIELSLRSTVATAVPVPGNVIVAAGTGHRSTMITVARDLWNAVITAGTGRRSTVTTVARDLWNAVATAGTELRTTVITVSRDLGNAMITVDQHLGNGAAARITAANPETVMAPTDPQDTGTGADPQAARARTAVDSSSSHRCREDSPRRESRHRSPHSPERRHSSRRRTRSRSPHRSTSYRSHRDSSPPTRRSLPRTRQAPSVLATPSSSQGYPLSMGSQPSISTTVSSYGVPRSSSVWESILGPKPTGAQELEENLFTLDAFRNQPSTPSFKLDYSHPSYNLEQVDPAKRNLFQAPAQKPQLSSQTWRKVCDLGNPYELPTDEGASTSSAKGSDSAASPTVLVIQSVRSVLRSSHRRRQHDFILPGRRGTGSRIGPGMQSTA